jgi:hypothetical protein
LIALVFIFYAGQSKCESCAVHIAFIIHKTNGTE